MNDFYSRLEKNLIGFDGGNIEAKLWFSGLEWGLSDEEIIDTMNRPTYKKSDYDIPYLSATWKSTKPNFYKWQFDQKTAKILCHVFDYNGDYKEYLKFNYCDKNSNEFKLNLFPLPANNINHWGKEHKAISKTEIKYHYQTFCALSRFKLLNDLVVEFKPKIIVCFGQGFIEEFKMAFWGKNHSKLHARKEHLIGNKNKIQILSSEQLPTLIVTPFLGRNLTANSELIAVAEVIKNHLTKI